MNIGIMYPARNPISPENWSGTPAGLDSGFRANGFRTTHIGTGQRPTLHHGRDFADRLAGRRGAVADRGPLRVTSRTRLLDKHLRRAPSMDAVVAMGTDLFDVSQLHFGGVPIVTYDDGTLAQMWLDAESDIRRNGYNESDAQRWIALQRRSMRAATLCCVSTSWAASSLVDHYGIDTSRIEVVGMGHNPFMTPSSKRWDVPQYLFVGIDWTRKNGDSVVNAFREVHRQYPEATLTLVGDHPPVHEPGVIDLGLIPRSDVRGQQRLRTAFDSSTAFVLPSLFDPSPIAYLEAASAGLPVVATCRGGASSMLGHGAIVVDPYDVGQITAAMLCLADSETAQQMGEAAKSHAVRSTWSHVASRIMDSVSTLRGSGTTS